MIYYTLKVDIMHVRWDPLDRFFNLVKVDNFCTVEHHTLTHVNCWQKNPFLCFGMKPFLHWEDLLPIFPHTLRSRRSSWKNRFVSRKFKNTDRTKTKSRRKEREKCYIFTLDANWKTTLSCQPENWRIPACGDIEDYSISI